jgi:hypothetical protein
MDAKAYIQQELTAGRLTCAHIETLTRAWQSGHGLHLDGKPGPDTRTSLEAAATVHTGDDDDEGPRIGIDVSRHQGAIDWGAVGASTSPKIAFAWIKASTGVNAPQPRFATNARGARAAGIPWGGYHWATPAPGDAVAEARDFAKRPPTAAAASSAPRGFGRWTSRRCWWTRSEGSAGNSSGIWRVTARTIGTALPSAIRRWRRC